MNRKPTPQCEHGACHADALVQWDDPLCGPCRNGEDTFDGTCCEGCDLGSEQNEDDD